MPHPFLPALNVCVSLSFLYDCTPMLIWRAITCPFFPFFNTNALPRINIGADVWGGSSIMNRCLLMLVLVYFAHRMGSV